MKVNGSRLLSNPLTSSKTLPVTSLTVRKIGTTLVADMLLLTVAGAFWKNGKAFAANSPFAFPFVAKFFPVNVIGVPGQPEVGLTLSTTGRGGCAWAALVRTSMPTVPNVLARTPTRPASC